MFELDRVYEFFYEKFRSNSKSFFQRNKLSASNDSFSTNLRSFQKSLLLISCGWTIFLFFSMSPLQRGKGKGRVEKAKRYEEGNNKFCTHSSIFFPAVTRNHGCRRVEPR